MRFDIFTLFPEMFAGVFDESMLKRARTANLAEFFLHNIRDYTTDKHHVTDDTPYAGGGGIETSLELSKQISNELGIVVTFLMIMAVILAAVGPRIHCTSATGPGSPDSARSALNASRSTRAARV